MRALQLVRRSYLRHAISGDEHADAVAHVRIPHFDAATGARGPAQGNLRCVQEEKAYLWKTEKMTHATTSRTRDSVSGA
jgi:hypothetical protein